MATGLYVATFLGTSQYFLCSFCLDSHRRTHLVLNQNFKARVMDNGLYTGGCFFKDVVNLVTVENPDSDAQQWIQCVRCNSRLGWKYVQVPLDHICAKARFYLNMGRVTFWDGNKICDAESGLPAADPGQGAPVQPLPAGDGQAAFVQPEEDEHANADHEAEPQEEDNELPAGFWYG